MPDDKPDLNKTHKNYTACLSTWERCIAAYEGTDALLAWGALERNERESSDNFEARKKEAYSFEYARSVVDLFSCYLFEKEPERTLGALGDDSLWQDFTQDCDLYGTDFDQFLKDQQRYASVYGHIGVLVDKADQAAKTRAEEKSKRLYPYLAAFHPKAILDWEYQRDDSGRPYLSYLKLRDEEGLYRLWWPDRWEVWKDAEGGAELVKSGTNPLGEIPFVWFYNLKSRIRNIGVSDIAGISRIDISIMRNLSHGEEVIKYSAFPMMRKPLKRAGSTPQGDDVAGPTAILEFDPDHPESKPDWLEAETKEPIDAILLWIEKKVAEIYRAVNTGGIQATEVSSQAKSGVALKYEFQQLNSKLASKAQNGQEMEKQVVRLWLKWQNTEEKFDEIKIDWPKRFSVEDLAADLENALVAKTLIGSEKFTKALAKVLARRVLTLPDEEWNEIDKDIDEGPVKPPAFDEENAEGDDESGESGEAEAA